jgi:hypothetical protein
MLTPALRLIARNDGTRSFGRRNPVAICRSMISATRSYRRL